MKKEGKNKIKNTVKTKQIAVLIALFAIVFVTSGVVAETVGLSKDAQKIVEDILKGKGIDPNSVEGIQEVNFEELPEQINVKNIDETRLAVYEIKPLEGNSFYVVTASDRYIKQKQTEVSGVIRYIMDFGYSGAMNGDGFLRTAVGVETSPEKGYVMIREGSITGISTNLEILQGSGEISITLYKNGEKIGFKNHFIVESGQEGKVMIDRDIQSIGTVKFEKTDVISMYVESTGDVIWKDVITQVELTESQE